jgi:RNA polymerase sigma-70 factor, ECF subfamily
VTRVPERSEERSAFAAGAAGARRKSQPSARRGLALASDVTDRRLSNIYPSSGHIADTDGPRRELDLNPSPDERFRELYEEHAETLARYVSRRTDRAEVQDVVSETFLTAWRRFAELPDDPVPWLFVTARKMIANRHRSMERKRALHDKVAADVRWVLEDETQPSEIDKRLLNAIAELPPAEREAFMLVAWDGLDVRRAAKAAACGTGTFRVRLHRARQRLKDQIGAQRPFVRLPDVQPSPEETR